MTFRKDTLEFITENGPVTPAEARAYHRAKRGHSLSDEEVCEALTDLVRSGKVRLVVTDHGLMFAPEE
jgi:hypothetical protein